MEDTAGLRVAIIGGGLVGSLSACFLARRGYHVDLYEYRDDIRRTPQVRGRSINLALSARGRAALRRVGLEDPLIAEHGIPMAGRMVHGRDCSQTASLYDPHNGQCIYSVGRRFLNELLLTETEKFPNVKLFFKHKLLAANLEEGCMVFHTPQGNVEKTADLLIGADGAHSNLRQQFLKRPMFNFSQEYIKHGFLELCIPPTSDGQFALDPHYLHIWPRGSFMMIALPNQDCSWTVTLFMPFDKFHSLNFPRKLLNFFENNFADALPLIGKDQLIADFFAAKPSPLISIKCHPHHVSGKAVLIGDAAHAMVPFYGQGMNAGFEDCLLLDEIMDKNKDMRDVLQEYSAVRTEDAEAICDLAMYNYIEMRDLVTRPSFLMRKRLDNILFTLAPEHWMPLYTSITFSSKGYKWCKENRQWQDKVLFRTMIVAGIMALGGFLLVGVSTDCFKRAPDL